jgi:hypothetical protein
MADDKLTLRTSQAGMRFIAQMTIYNSGDFERLRKYIDESYHPDLLTEQSVDARIAELREWHEAAGKIKVRQVIGTSKHHVIVLLDADLTDSYWLNDLTVEEDYPHRIIKYSVSAID